MVATQIGNDLLRIGWITRMDILIYFSPWNKEFQKHLL